MSSVSSIPFRSCIKLMGLAIIHQVRLYLHGVMVMIPLYNSVRAKWEFIVIFIVFHILNDSMGYFWLDVSPRSIGV